MSVWPTWRGKPGPRWSVPRFAGLEPALTAGLPAGRARVWEGPPLLASAPSWGSVPGAKLLPPSVMVAPAWLRTRLKLTAKLAAADEDEMSGPVAAVLLAMMVL